MLLLPYDKNRMSSSSTASVAVLDQSGVIMAVNATWLDLARENKGASLLSAVGVGVNYVEVCRRAAAALVEGAQEALLGLQAVLEGREILFTLNYPSPSPAGERWYQMTATRLPEELGRVVVSHLDITTSKQTQEQSLWSAVEKAQAEEALRQSEARFRVLANAAPHVVWTAAPDGTITFANQRWFDYVGITPAENARRWPELVLHPDDRERCLAQWTEALQTGTEYEIEVRNQRYDGQFRWFLTRAVPMRNEAGQIVAWFGTTTDIHDLKETERKLREREEQLRVITDAVPGLIAEVDQEQRYQFVNAAYEKWFGQPREQILGRTIHELNGPERYEHVRPYIEKVMAGEQVTFENTFIYPEDDKTVLATYVPRRGTEGQVLGFYIMVLDITQRKRAEQAERLLAEAGKVLASSLDYSVRLSHVAELAVPLLADWCAVTLIEEDGVTVHNVAVAHSDPDKLALAREMQRRYPARPEELAKQAQPWQHGQSELYPEITEAMLEAGAQDAEHYQFLRDLHLRSAMVVPLVARERVLGVMLFVWAESGRRYDEQDLALAEELARRAAVALDNAHAYQAEQQARQEAEEAAERITGLQAVTAALSQALTPGDVVEVIIRHSVSVLEATGGAVMLLTEDGASLEILRAVGYSEAGVKPFLRFPVAASIPASEAVRTRQPVWITSHHDFEARYPHLAPIRPAESRTEGVAVVPLLLEDRVLGAIAISFTEVREYSLEDEEFLLTIASQCSQALERARLYEAEQSARLAAEKAAERIASLQAVTVALSRAITPTQVARVIVQALKMMGAEAGLIALLDPPREQLERLHYFGYPPSWMAHWRFLPLSEPTPLSETVRSGVPIFIESAEMLKARYPELPREDLLGYEALVTLPLKLRRRTLGGIRLSFSRVRSFSENEQAFMLTLARQCAQAIERARLYHAERQARTEAEAAQQSLALLAEIRERHRLAQELHDNVAQALGYLNLKVTLTHELLESNRLGEARANLRELKQIVSETYTDIRGEIFNLRTAPSTEINFLETLRQYIDKYRRFYKLDIELVLEDDESHFEFPADAAISLIRTIQEALINVRKHAQVNKALLHLGYQAGQVRIKIKDEGQGFDLTTEKEASFGLKIMRERMESIGGRLEIGSTPGKGTEVILLYQQG